MRIDTDVNVNVAPQYRTALNNKKAMSGRYKDDRDDATHVLIVKAGTCSSARYFRECNEKNTNES